MDGAALAVDSLPRSAPVLAEGSSLPPVAAPEPARMPSPAANRVELLDAARMIAVTGIIWLHGCETPSLRDFGSLGTFGVPFYVFVALYFMTRSFRREPERLLHVYLWHRFLRLYVPFIAWSAIYLVARDAKQSILLHKGMIPFDPAMLWVGSAYHLWFLPFLLFASVFASVIVKYCVNRPQSAWTAIFVLAAFGCALSFVPRPDWLNYTSSSAAGIPFDPYRGYFMYQVWRALPSFFCGIAMAWSLCATQVNASAMPIIGATGFFLTAATIGEQLVNGYSRLDRTLSGLGWFLAALTPYRSTFTVLLGKLGKHSFGIYLSHVLFIEGIQAMFHKYGYRESVTLDLAVVSLSLLSSSALTLLLIRSKYTRWLAGAN